jgi:hypothetical protein
LGLKLCKYSTALTAPGGRGFLNGRIMQTSFYFKWGPFLLGLFFGIFGALLSLIIPVDRRDRFYSALLGLGINLLITFIYLKSGGRLPAYP